eukprot:g38548.t1
MHIQARLDKFFGPGVALHNVHRSLEKEGAASAEMGGQPTKETKELVKRAQEGKLLPDDAALINQKDEEGFTALAWASHEGQGNAVKNLLQNKADPNLRIKDEATALILAGKNGHKEVAEALLQAKAEINAKDNDGKTALDLARENDQPVMAKLLEEAAKLTPEQLSDKAEWKKIEAAVKKAEEDGSISSDNVSVAEDSLQQHPITMQGTSIVGPKNKGAAYRFDGQKSYVDVGPLGTCGALLSSFAISMWVRFPEASSTPQILLKAYEKSGQGVSIEVGRTGDQKTSTPGSTTFWLRDTKGQELSHHVDAPMGHGQWRHLVWSVHDALSQHFAIYVDGRLLAGTPADAKMPSPANEGPTEFVPFASPVLLGAGKGNETAGGGPTGYFTGDMRQVALYQGPLTPDQVTVLFRQQVAIGDACLLAYWPMDTLWTDLYRRRVCQEMGDRFHGKVVGSVQVIREQPTTPQAVEETKKEMDIIEALWSDEREERPAWRKLLEHPPTFPPAPRARDLVDKVLRGASDALDQAGKDDLRMIRPFISSTFTDTVEERNALIRDVYPFIAKYANRVGVQFIQPSEMRWGIRGFAAANHLTSSICMEEIARCQSQSRSLNYVLILGNKYGYRPFPSKIPSEEFQTLANHIKAMGQADDWKLVEEWFWLDSNGMEYVLQPSDSSAAHGDWWSIFAKLQRILRTASKSLLDPARQRMYEMSVTEEEALHGVLEVNSTGRQNATFVFRRVAEGEPEITDDTKQFVDMVDQKVDQDAQNRLKALREKEISASLPPSRLRDYTLKWNKGKIEKPAEYLRLFCDDFCDLVIKAINEVAERYSVLPDPVYEEALFHLRSVARKNEAYTSITAHQAAIQGMDSYLKSESSVPYVVMGQSGTGKTSALAFAFAQWQRARPEQVAIVRLLGTTLYSANIRSVLWSLCEQIRLVFGEAKPAPTGYKALKEQFPGYLALARPDKPIVLFVDSLDQLSDRDGGRDLHWLPTTLPPYVKLVLSTLPDEGNSYKRLKALLGEKLQEAKISDLESGDSTMLLDGWLSADRRSLTYPQRQQLLAHCPTPLYLRIAYNEAKTWPSYKKHEETILPNTVPALIARLFASLEQEHGEVLVSATLGLMTISQNGLSQAEMLDILSCYDPVMESVFEWWTPPIRRLPPHVLTGLLADLEPYLSVKGVDGGVPVYNWYHRQFWEAATRSYLTGDKPAILAGLLVDYFSGTWAHAPKPYTNKGKQDTQLALRHILNQTIFIPGGDNEAARPNLRKLSELPAAILVRKDYQRLEQCVCDFEFLSAMLQASRIYDAIRYLNVLQKERPTSRVKEYTLLIKSNALQFQWFPGSLLQHALYMYTASCLYQEAKVLLGDASVGPRGQHREARRYLSWESIPPTRRPACENVMTAHEKGVRALAVSPDKTQAITGCQGGRLSLWDIMSGEQVLGVQGLTDSSYDGLLWPRSRTHILAFGKDGDLQLFEASTLSLVKAVKMYPQGVTKDEKRYEGKPVFSGLLAEDHQQVLMCGDMQRLAVYSLPGLDLMSEIPEKDHAYSMALSDTMLATGHACGQVRIRRVSSHAPLTIEPEPFRTLTMDNTISRYIPQCLAFSPDGKQLSAGPQSIGTWGDGSNICVWDTAEWNKRSVRHENLTWPGTNKIAYTKDGKRLLVATQNTILKVLDSATGQLLSQWTDRSYASFNLEFSNFAQTQLLCTDGNSLLQVNLQAASSDAKAGVSWPSNTNPVGGGITLFPEDHMSFITPVGRNVTGSAFTMTIDCFKRKAVEMGRKTTEPGYEFWANTNEWSPDGSLVAFSGLYHIFLLDVKNWALSRYQVIETRTNAACMRFSPDVRTLVFTYAANMYAFDLAERKVVKKFGEEKGVNWFVFHPQGHELFVGQSTGDVSVWDMKTYTKKQDLEGTGPVVYLRALEAFQTSVGTFIVCGTTSDQVQVWFRPEQKGSGDLPAYRHVFDLYQFSAEDEVVRVQVSPDLNRANARKMSIHPHTLSFKQAYEGGRYGCDACGANLAGKSWNCQQCGWDACPHCSHWHNTEPDSRVLYVATKAGQMLLWSIEAIT